MYIPLDAPLSSIAAFLASCALTAMGAKLEFPCEGKWFVVAAVLIGAVMICLWAACKRLPKIGEFAVRRSGGGFVIKIELLPADPK